MDISIISINYNNSQLTLDFVRSVIDKTSSVLSYEIIIVDNNSEIEDYNNLINILSEYKNYVNIIRSSINTGFGGGNMYGIQYATGDYLAFINNDVIFIEDCLSSLINFMKKNSKIGVSTAQQIDRNGKPALSFDYFHGLRKELIGERLVELTSKKIKSKNSIYTKSVPVDFVQGAFMFFDAAKFSEVGGFDTNLFLYYEEMDICFRLKQNGYLSYFNPSTKFIHLEGESTVKKYSIKRELKISKLYILRKNNNYVKYNIIRLYYLIKYLFKSILFPIYWKLFFIILTGRYLENSLKHSQKVRFLKTKKTNNNI